MKRICLIVAGALLLGSPNFSIAADAPTTAPTTAPSEEGVSRFYGTVSTIDPKAKTFTIDNVTYSIVDATQMTKAAEIADVAVGETARGTYTRSSDGKMHVTKVRFGKKANGKTGGGGGGGGKAGGKKSKDATQPAN